MVNDNISKLFDCNTTPEMQRKITKKNASINQKSKEKGKQWVEIQKEKHKLQEIFYENRKKGNCQRIARAKAQTEEINKLIDEINFHLSI